MTSARKNFADLFLPLRPKRAPAKCASSDENPAIQEIWGIVAAIPRGQVSTYGAVARAAGLPGSARLAGLALKLSPPDLPWHRVVGAGGRIVFAPATRHHREQSRRLRAEGVAVTNGRVSRSCMSDLGEP